MTRAYNVVDADGHVLEPSICGTTTWTQNSATGRRG
jgi:hypothetical protein